MTPRAGRPWTRRTIFAGPCLAYREVTSLERLRVEPVDDFFGLVAFGEFDKRKDWVLEIANLRGSEKRITGTLSGGWKQRLALGCAVLHKPKIVFLDEPTSGVDPVMRRKFWELINDLSAEEITVLVTTHFLEEAEYCNDIILINAGKIIAGGSPKELKENYIKNPILEVQCENVIEAMSLIEKERWAIETSVFGTYLHVSVEDEIVARKNIERLLSSSGMNAIHIDKITPSLEDVFIYLLDMEEKKRES